LSQDFRDQADYGKWGVAVANVWDRSESIVGRVDDDGTVWDGLSIVGRVDSGGTVWNRSESIVGRVDAADRSLQGGAALLLISASARGQLEGWGKGQDVTEGVPPLPVISFVVGVGCAVAAITGGGFKLIVIDLPTLDEPSDLGQVRSPSS
jgi:hypothetical protein